MTRYNIEHEVHHTLEVKKSQFITWIKSIESRAQAMSFLEQAKKQYPDARHHCWAYMMGVNANSQTAAMSDDGEPSGTAGKPMLNVLQHKPVDNVMVIVSRYFGGIKLGAGGLVRAYSQAVEQCFNLASLIEIVPQTLISTQVTFGDEQWLRHQVNKISGDIINTEYLQSVKIVAAVPNTELSTLINLLQGKQIPYQIED